jgi:thiol-disulfide isomerase/thioredoxin
MPIGGWTVTAHHRGRIVVRSPISRRTLLKGALATTAASVMGRADADARSDGPPPFGTVRHQFTVIRGARPIPSVPVPRLDGKPIDLTAFRGKVVLVNFWATWCAACKTELPILDRLQDIETRANLQVIAIATDRVVRSDVTSFVRNLKLRHLDVGIDPGGLVARAGEVVGPDTPFSLYAMPISYVIGTTGQVEGYLAGEADWTSEDARRLLDYYRARGSG